MSLVNLLPISSNFFYQPNDIIKTIVKMDVANLVNMNQLNHHFNAILKIELLKLKWEQKAYYSINETDSLSCFLQKFPENERPKMRELTAYKISWPILWEASTWDKNYAKMIKKPSFIKKYLESCYTSRDSGRYPEIKAGTLIELIKFLPEDDRPQRISLPLHPEERGTPDKSNPLISKVLSLLSNLAAIDLSFHCTLSDEDAKLLTGDHLTTLSLDAYTLFSENQFVDIIKNSPNLRALKCVFPTPGSFSALQETKQLTELSFAYKKTWGEKEIEAFRILLPRLTKLEIHANRLTCDQFQQLFSLFPKFNQSLKLRSVKLCNSSLDNQGLELLLKNSSSIEEIDLSNTQITDVSLPLITKHLQQLRSIAVVQCKNLTPIGVLNFVNQHSSLKEIYTGQGELNYRC